ncbi:MAG: rhomboid family intramembrane serine protease [Phycisphaeraceae bacterium]|nr:rhomboid family intramembrane serine protease [Phycisphaeraceae bacterium]
MAWQDRVYSGQGRPGGDPSGRGAFGGLGGGRFDGAAVTLWLIILNTAVFFLDQIFKNSARASALSPSYWGEFSLDTAISHLQLWRWLTYQFLHQGFFHLFFNMLGLFFFAPLIERWWGSRRFLGFYLLCGVSGAVFYSLLYPVIPYTNWYVPLVGASGAVFGVLVGCAVAFPDVRVMLLIPPIPMTMRAMALIFLGIAALSLIAGSQNAGGEAAHLGGAAMGFVLIKFPVLLRPLEGSRASRRPGKLDWRTRWRQKRLQRHHQQILREQAEVDRILDKVHNHGLQSLTDKEKRLLHHATERQRRGE